MRTIEWESAGDQHPSGAVSQPGIVKMVDQRKLPLEYVVVEFDDYRDVAMAIKEMYIRGAPAIGAAAGFGMALAAYQSSAAERGALLRDLEVAADVLRQARPTAANLFWAIDRMLRVAGDEVASLMKEEYRSTLHKKIEEVKEKISSQPNYLLILTNALNLRWKNLDELSVATNKIIHI